jgi:hypothetical protein
MVAIFLQHFRAAITSYHPMIVAHFHEWQAGLQEPTQSDKLHPDFQESV